MVSYRLPFTVRRVVRTTGFRHGFFRCLRFRCCFLQSHGGQRLDSSGDPTSGSEYDCKGGGVGILGGELLPGAINAIPTGAAYCRSCVQGTFGGAGIGTGVGAGICIGGTSISGSVMGAGAGRGTGVGRGNETSSIGKSSGGVAGAAIGGVPGRLTGRVCGPRTSPGIRPGTVSVELVGVGHRRSPMPPSNRPSVPTGAVSYGRFGSMIGRTARGGGGRVRRDSSSL